MSVQWPGEVTVDRVRVRGVEEIEIVSVLGMNLLGAARL